MEESKYHQRGGNRPNKEDRARWRAGTKKEGPFMYKKQTTFNLVTLKSINEVQFSEITQAITEAFPKCIQTFEKRLQQERQAIDLMSRWIRENVPESEVKLTGSVKAGFSTYRSNLDMWIMVGPRENKRAVMDNFAKFLDEQDGTLYYRPKGGFPTLSFRTMFNLFIKVGINNFQAIQWAKLFRAYSRFDVRVSQLVKFIKLWALKNGLTATSEGFLSTHVWQCMCISFFQVYKILPALQIIDHTPVMVGKVDMGFAKSGTLASTNTHSIGVLLMHFFYYYSVALPSKTNITANIRTGALKEGGIHTFLYNILDPLTEKNIIPILRECTQAETVINRLRDTYNALANGIAIYKLI